MNNSMRIGELASRVGIAQSTVRYYERRGLLRPDARTKSNYRVYGPEALARLRFIRAAQSSGLSLEDIQTILGFSDGNVAPCEEVQSVIDSKLEHVRQQVTDLRRVQRALERLHDECCGADRGGLCPAVEQFRGS